MVDITAQRATTAPPELVLATLKETSPDSRQALWSNVTPKYFELHDAGPDWIEVTEGTFIAGRFWERSRYEWSAPDRVTATVLESNVFRPGSTFELRARARADGGSHVEVSVRRRFQRSPKGWIAATVNNLGGRRLFGWYLGTVLKAVERRDRDSAGPSPASGS